MYTAPFTPGITSLITLSGSTQSVALGLGGGASGTPQVLLTNGPAGTPAICYFKFGSSSVTAAVTDTPLLPNSTLLVTPPAGTTHIAAIGSTSGVLYATTGHGA